MRELSHKLSQHPGPGGHSSSVRRYEPGYQGRWQGPEILHKTRFAIVTMIHATFNLHGFSDTQKALRRPCVQAKCGGHQNSQQPIEKRLVL